MKRLNFYVKNTFALIFSMLLFGCGNSSTKHNPNSSINKNSVADQNNNKNSDNYYEEFLIKVKTYQSKLKFHKDVKFNNRTQYFEIDPDFDFQKYLLVFDKTDVLPGYKIDFKYMYNGEFGYPFIYALPKNETFNDLKKEYVKCESCSTDFWRSDIDQMFADYVDSTNFQNHMCFEASKHGAYQFLLLDLIGGRFAYYPASGYGMDHVIVSQSGLREVASHMTKGDFYWENDTLRYKIKPSVKLFNRVEYRRSEIDSILNIETEPIIFECPDYSWHVSILCYHHLNGLSRREYKIPTEPYCSVSLLKDSVLLEFR